MSVKINNVTKKSPAFFAGIKSNDVLISINGHEISDVLDYMFYCAEKELSIVVQSNEETRTLSVIKNDNEQDLGLLFDTYLMSEKQSCKNNCVFCFIDQNPENMRETIYFKDDDSRLSFLQGNYITLNSLNDKDVERIIQMKLSVNISVHTTNPELRCKMMNNRFAGDKLKYLKQLGDNNIKINCQIVLCPNYNDGNELIKTLNDLGKLYPAVESIAVVPVGLTKHRNGLAPLKSVDKTVAIKTLKIIDKFQTQFLQKHGTRLVYAADEFYIISDTPLPSFDEYEEFCQYENGVGMMRSFIDEFNGAYCDAYWDLSHIFWDVHKNISVATGVAAYPFICELIGKITHLNSDFKCNVYKIDNEFFGESITVTGLLTGRDIINQLKNKDLGDELLLSESMLKKDSDLFLDDCTVGDVERELGVKVTFTKNDGGEFFDRITAKN